MWIWWIWGMIILLYMPSKRGLIFSRGIGPHGFARCGIWPVAGRAKRVHFDESHLDPAGFLITPGKSRLTPPSELQNAKGDDVDDDTKQTEQDRRSSGETSGAGRARRAIGIAGRSRRSET